jgi:hypothetical protein
MGRLAGVTFRVADVNDVILYVLGGECGGGERQRAGGGKIKRFTKKGLANLSNI